MAEWINRDKVLLMSYCTNKPTWDNPHLDPKSVVDVEDIESLPAADVVEVVRCKDCEHARPIDKTKAPEKYFKDDCVVCECEDVVGEEPMIYRPDHFCSYGERRC